MITRKTAGWLLVFGKLHRNRRPIWPSQLSDGAESRGADSPIRPMDTCRLNWVRADAIASRATTSTADQAKNRRIYDGRPELHRL